MTKVVIPFAIALFTFISSMQSIAYHQHKELDKEQGVRQSEDAHAFCPKSSLFDLRAGYENLLPCRTGKGFVAFLL